mmetsp:Transcript_48682/g.96074  ORF Transcript_48682/g.96074 Transcript_48682/m.96074 type:complete len:133 (+) Transcript_48682:278-676(+)
MNAVILRIKSASLSSSFLSEPSPTTRQYKRGTGLSLHTPMVVHPFCHSPQDLLSVIVSSCRSVCLSLYLENQLKGERRGTERGSAGKKSKREIIRKSGAMLQGHAMTERNVRTVTRKVRERADRDANESFHF